MFAIITIAILCLFCVAVSSDTAPILSLNQHYHFDGTNNHQYVHLSGFDCVKGNKPRTIQFEMKSSHQTASYLVGKSIFNLFYSFMCLFHFSQF